MADKLYRLPGRDHPITVEPADNHVVVRVGGNVIADTHHALALHEASYPVVWYIPREDADMSLLERTGLSTHCPFKGDAAYYSIVTGAHRRENAVWTYEAPHEAVAAIRDHLAFYPDRVDSITIG